MLELAITKRGNYLNLIYSNPENAATSVASRTSETIDEDRLGLPSPSRCRTLSRTCGLERIGIGRLSHDSQENDGLGTIKRKLERKQYYTATECANDFRLIWANCMAYNADGSDFWLLAKSFARRFEDRYRKIRQESKIGSYLLFVV